MDLHTTLERHFGYPGFRAGQEELVRTVLDGRDALGILPTGGGKSVCYMLPAALLPGLTVVVSPLISLMEDQVHRATEAGLRAALLNSTLSPDRRAAVLAGIREGGLDLLLVAPERFAVSDFREALSSRPVSLLAIDEAHCIAEWGYDFRPSYLRLGPVRAALGAPCLALTATATPGVRDGIVRALGLRDPLRHVGSFDRANLVWEVVRVDSEADRFRRFTGLVRDGLRSEDGVIIAYAGTRRTVETLRDRLAGLGLSVRAYHGGMRAESRAAVQADFMAGDCRLVIATNAFGMGVDKPDVRLVVHWQLPGSLEGYYQEAGRAGRDGGRARCVAFHRRGDGVLHLRFLDRSRPAPGVLLRAFGALRRTLGPEGRGLVHPAGLARSLGSGWGTERAEGAIRALAGAGLLRVEGGDETGFRVSLRPGRPDTSRARALRRGGLARIEAVRRYAEEARCRRYALLRYFGETPPAGRCGGCDVCRGDGPSGRRSIGERISGLIRTLHSPYL